jgi:phosphopantetheine adenylyltransferase
MFETFINEYGNTLLYTVLTAILGFIGIAIKSLLERFVNDKRKQKIVETCVKAAEQIYKDLKGNDKLQKVKENIVAMLNENGLTISELEMDMLIEAAVAEMNKQINKESVENVEN